MNGWGVRFWHAVGWLCSASLTSLHGGAEGMWLRHCRPVMNGWGVRFWHVVGWLCSASLTSLHGGAEGTWLRHCRPVMNGWGVRFWHAVGWLCSASLTSLHGGAEGMWLRHCRPVMNGWDVRFWHVVGWLCSASLTSLHGGAEGTWLRHCRPVMNGWGVRFWHVVGWLCSASLTSLHGLQWERSESCRCAVLLYPEVVLQQWVSCSRVKKVKITSVAARVVLPDSLLRPCRVERSRSSFVYRAEKTSQLLPTEKSGGLLNPLSIPDYRWESVSMDFITKLPSGSHGYDAICVFVDRLSKMVHFVPCREDLKARRFAQLFIDNVYKLHGMPAELISDRGSLFTSVFWREVMRRCGSKPALSSSYHPQSDGQTERYNRVLEEMLRHYISPTQSDWPDYLALAEFAVNNSWQESIQSTPFLVNTGQSPVTIGLRDLPYGGRCPSAHAYTRWWQDAVANARKCMVAAQSRQAAYANKARRDVEYKVGQKVLLSTKDLKLKPGKARKLIPRYVGPFEILLLVGAVAVKLDLPASMSRLHPVFHVSLIKPYTGTDVGFMPPPVTWMDETPVYYVERLLDHKGVKDNKASFYLVQWEGYDSTHNNWEPRSNLTGCDKILAEYNAIHHLT
ncbi:hypothetical protein QJQ45_009164 [Haematococcus lacustris]|nr:hypothetical protein QJQ45_009164 [Haematococcus lacustris]